MYSEGSSSCCRVRAHSVGGIWRRRDVSAGIQWHRERGIRVGRTGAVIAGRVLKDALLWTWRSEPQDDCRADHGPAVTFSRESF
jgi:hypothetical protein